jgi:hypothetical protein
VSQILTTAASDHREFKTEQLQADLVVVGGGMAGTCCAITAARAGAKVVLVQDRPVLGGNASSEIRLWVLGATAHMANNNRWAREGGLHDEVLVENMFRNREGNGVIFDTILLEKVVEEPNITLLLNTALVEAVKGGTDGDRVDSVRAFCSQNSTMYAIKAPLYCDSTGDGALGYLSGAAFRMGAESREEFGEKFAPSEEYGALLGHSLYFYTKDLGHPVKFVAPSYALDDITTIPRYRSFNTREHGCKLWWIEYGGRLDTVHDTERIKWELWQVVYGVWNHLKNSGEFPEAENLTLEWVGLIPGKRESRRFEGHHMLTQHDLLDQVEHADGVALGGWSIDLHPADGVFSEHPGSNHLHGRGIYQIPYRSLVSRNVSNLFFAGRLISASHVAFGSTRVMGTGANMGQAAGMAAALCARAGLEPASLLEPERMHELRRELLKAGQHIPRVPLEDPADLARTAELSATSQFELGELPADGGTVPLDFSRAQLLPLPAGRVPQVTVTVDVEAATTLRAELRTGQHTNDDYTPDVVLAVQEIELAAGVAQQVKLDFDASIDQDRYAFVCLLRNEDVSVHVSTLRATGLLAVRHRATQEPDEAIGRPRIEFWTPERRPGGANLALTVEPPLRAFGGENLRNGYARPTAHPNAWVAAPGDEAPAVELRWPEPKRISRIDLSFDTDFDHAMESVLYGHPEDAMPFCVKHYQVLAGERVLAERADNHQSRDTVHFDPPLSTDRLTVSVVETHGAPAAIFEVRAYE